MVADRNDNPRSAIPEDVTSLVLDRPRSIQHMSGATAAAPAWKQFTFFDVSPVKDAHDLGSTPEIFKNVPELSTVVSTSTGIIIADIHGCIHVLGADFVPKHSWVAHLGGRVTHMAEGRGVLVSIGEEFKVPVPLLKIWDLQHFDKKTGSPMLLRSTKLLVGSKSHPVSTIALSSSLSHLAIGFGDGSVQLYRHLDQSIFSGATQLTALPKPKTIHDSPGEAVTGLGFREPKLQNGTNEKQDALLHLFIVTINRVLCYIASGKSSGNMPTVVAEVGCGLGCAVMDSTGQEMLVARDEAIYMCGIEGKGASYAYEGTKSSVYSHKSYLVIVTPPFYPKPSSTSATIRNFVARAPDPSSTSLQDISKVTIFDPTNRFVAYSGPFKEGVREVMFRGDEVYILANDGQLYLLDEKPISVKLDILFKQSRFSVAVSVARSAGVDESGIADIYRQYGDHLYSKGDDDGAMQQYVKTIGYLQPSYVIRKFLDAKRISNLTVFLQELHERGLANADHTTLLLNTYTKLKDVARLDTFIKTESHRPSFGDDLKNQEPPFDLDTAIRVCRQGGYFEQAVYLARKYKRHEDYLRIQIEDAANLKEALLYVRELGPESAEPYMARYGRPMLASIPEETTQLLIELCSGAGFATPPEIDDRPASPIKGGEQPVLGHQRQASIRRSHHDNDSSRAPTPPPSQVVLKKGPPPRKLPSPRQYFAHFVDHMEYFLQFLEAVARNRWHQTVPSVLKSKEDLTKSPPPLDEYQEKADQISVWNTLLELYITQSTSSASTTMHDKALAVLKDAQTYPYDQSHALLVCSTYSFTDGLVILWEKLGMYDDIIRFWIEKENAGVGPDASGVRPSDQVLRHLKRYGPANHNLYILTLRFLTSSSALLSRHTSDLEDILDHVENERIVPPLGVVQVMSRNDVTSVGLIRDWLMRCIKTSREEIAADRAVVESYQKEMTAKLQEVAELSDPDNPRIFHVTRCSACGGQLELPAVHFMCKHSYHQRCLSDHETECPNCAQAHGLIKEIKAQNEEFARHPEMFLSSVKDNGFEAIADGFSKGLLGSSSPSI